MLARYVRKGDSIDFRPSSGISAGDVVVIADLVGIAQLDIEANTLGSLAVVGVFDVVKANETINFGSTAYWDAGAKRQPLFPAPIITSARRLPVLRREMKRSGGF